MREKDAHPSRGGAFAAVAGGVAGSLIIVGLAGGSVGRSEIPGAQLLGPAVLCVSIDEDRVAPAVVDVVVPIEPRFLRIRTTVDLGAPVGFGVLQVRADPMEAVVMPTCPFAPSADFRVRSIRPPLLRLA